MLEKMDVRVKRLIALALACVALLLIGGYLFFFRRDKSSNDESAKVQPQEQLSHRQKLRLDRIAMLEKKMFPDNIPSKKIVGYYASWAAYEDYTPLFIDGSKVTHINYAFADISEDLLVEVGDPEVDMDNFQDLRELKEFFPHLKTLISVGGWTWSGRFSDAASTAKRREAFADSAVDFMLNYGFDGIDLDWEYPVAGGMSENRVRPEDKQNFTALIKTIREKLDKQSAEDGKEYLLTIAGAASEKYINNIEMNKLSKYLDYINVMTYDINGPWDSYNDFNAALYPHDKKGKDQQWSVSQGIKLYLAQGVPSAKLVMGVPFYGYKYELKEKGQTDDEGLLQSFSQGMYMDCGRIEKEFSQKQSFKRFWQDTSKVPWLYDGNTFITYEDAQSMTEKVRYAVDMNLGGLMIWELSNDPDNVLLNAINDEFSNEAEK